MLDLERTRTTLVDFHINKSSTFITRVVAESKSLVPCKGALILFRWCSSYISDPAGASLRNHANIQLLYSFGFPTVSSKFRNVYISSTRFYGRTTSVLGFSLSPASLTYICGNGNPRTGPEKFDKEMSLISGDRGPLKC